MLPAILTTQNNTFLSNQQCSNCDSSILPEKKGTQSNLDPEIPTLGMEARKCNEKLDIQAASFQFKKSENTRIRRGTVPWSWECYLKVDEVEAEVEEEEALTW